MPSFPEIKPGDPQGLVFESPSEPVESLLPWFDFRLREVELLRVGDDGESSPNYLIEGDNLAALMLLQGTHEGAFDLIYIDPPHNTRSKALTYSDDFTRAGDAFPHARWLAFMERRLRLARNLMSGGGSIFISIDDREAAALRLLCDELLGERNFVASIVWEKKAHAQNDARWLSVNHGSILVYAKDKRTWRPNLLPPAPRRWTRATATSTATRVAHGATTTCSSRLTAPRAIIPSSCCPGAPFPLPRGCAGGRRRLDSAS